MSSVILLVTSSDSFAMRFINFFLSCHLLWLVGPDMGFFFLSLEVIKNFDSVHYAKIC